MSKCKSYTVGTYPISLKWNVVRGDTAKLVVEFFEDDEKTYIDTSGWTFQSSAFNPASGIVDDLDVSVDQGFVTLIADPFVTEGWGSASSNKVASLRFDLQVINNLGETWTPIVGTISVVGDVTGADL